MFPALASGNSNERSLAAPRVIALLRIFLVETVILIVATG